MRDSVAAGVRHARGGFIIAVNFDTVVWPDAIVPLVEPLLERTHGEDWHLTDLIQKARNRTRQAHACVCHNESPRRAEPARRC